MMAGRLSLVSALTLGCVLATACRSQLAVDTKSQRPAALSPTNEFTAQTPADKKVVASALIATSPLSTSGFINDVVADTPTVRAEDASGKALPGVAVAFAVTAGDGNVTVTTVTTDAAGLATAVWTLGSARGTDNNTLTATTASLDGTLLTVSFTASGLDPICDVPATASPFQSGDGTAANPYQICTPAQFQAIGADAAQWSANYRLAADLDMAAYDGSSAAATYNIIGTLATPFTGSFDGAGHTISHLIVLGAAANAGMFGVVDGSEIKSFTLADASLTTNTMGESHFGLIAGQVTDAWFHDITASGRFDDETGTITSSGGLFGPITMQTPGLVRTWSNIVATIALSGMTDTIGGFTDHLTITSGASLTIRNVTLTVDIASSANSRNTFGGFVAYTKVNTGSTLVLQDIAAKGSIVIQSYGSFSGNFIGTLRVDGAGSTVTMTRLASDVSLTLPNDYPIFRGDSGGFIGSGGLTNGATMTLSESRQTGDYHETNTTTTTASHGGLLASFSLSGAGTSLDIHDVYVDDDMSFSGVQGHSNISLGIGVLTVSAGTTVTMSRVFVAGSITGTALTYVGGFFGKTSLSGTVTLGDAFYDSDAEAVGSGSGADPTGLSGKTLAQLQSSATFTGWDSAIWNIRDGVLPTLKALPPL